METLINNEKDYITLFHGKTYFKLKEIRDDNKGLTNKFSFNFCVDSIEVLQI